MHELRRTRTALRRWWWLVALATVIGAVGGIESAEASGGPQWVTSASITVARDGTRLDIDLVPVQAALDLATSGATKHQVVAAVGAFDVSAAIARHGPDDERRVVHITVASADKARASVALREFVQRFEDALAGVRVAQMSVSGPGVVTTTDISAPRAPTSAIAVALLGALALGSLTAALVGLLGSDPSSPSGISARSPRRCGR